LKKHQQTIFFIFLLWIYVALPVQGQYKILENGSELQLVHQAIDSIYNHNFTAADIMIADLEKKLPDYPGIMLLKAFYVSWKYQPIKKEHAAFGLFESYLQKAIAQSESMLLKDSENLEADFFLLASHAYLAELYMENGMSFKALGEAKSAYKYIKIGFDHTEDIPEFYFSSGIYNYYREKYPEENPFYKSFLWFFRNGDMQEGLAMLKKGSQLAIFTQAECFRYLFHINLRYEDKPQAAIYYAQILKNKYPYNLAYLANYIENSIRLNQYDGLLPCINKMLQSDKTFYRYLGEIFYGNYLEHKDINLDGALTHYRNADKLGDIDAIRVPHYDSILFLGLGRINKQRGNTDLANQYIKKSIKSAEYSAYRKDAEALLNN